VWAYGDSRRSSELDRVLSNAFLFLHFKWNIAIICSAAGLQHCEEGGLIRNNDVLRGM
jgi:hypothetical protein